MATATLIFLGLVTLFWVLLALSPAHAATFRNVISSETPFSVGAPLPAVTLIIAARNEGTMLPTTLPSWCTQDYPDLRIIVVDDQSDDDTADVLARYAAEYPNLTVVQAPPRPDDWLGKPWAVMQGVALAQTDWLLFSDADCAFHPRCVRHAVRIAETHRLDMLSLFPRLLFGSFLERVALAGMLTAINVVFPAGWANDPRRPKVALAAGGFILCRREPYEKIGGHRAVRAHMVEDVNLARKLKQSGARVYTTPTSDLVTTRMYEGFDDLWEGLTKNAYAGLEYHPLRFWLAYSAGLLLFVLPPAYLLACAVWAGVSRSENAFIALGLALAINVIQAVVHARAVRYLGLPRWYAFTISLSAGLYTTIGAASAWQNHFGGGNVWKGRRYDRKLLLGATTDERE